MPEEVKKKRGRPRKNPVVETNSQSSPTSEKTNELVIQIRCYLNPFLDVDCMTISQKMK